jgi:hypothetical protein
LACNRIMIHGSANESELDRVDEALRRAPEPTAALLREVLRSAGGRSCALRRAGKTVGLNRLIDTGAWTDASLALIALELPNWCVRRLVYEDGEWLCTLSRRPNLPLEIDDVAEATHPSITLAILRAVMEARRQTAASPAIDVARRLQPLPEAPVCCDNFA